MAARTGKTDRPGISIWRIIAAAVSVIILVAAWFNHANFVAGRSLLLAFPGWDVSYKSCWPNPFGGAWVSDVTLIAYRRYVENGAPLDLVLTYSPMVSGERYHDLDIGRWVAYMHGGFNVDGRVAGVGMKSIDVRPLPEDDEAASTWGLLQSERAAGARPAQAIGDEATPVAVTRNADTPPPRGCHESGTGRRVRRRCGGTWRSRIPASQAPSDFS